MKQTCILVLGMHRSGTSALTGVLSLLDIYLGSELMVKNFANVKGYFENNFLYEVNEKLLDQVNSAWDDVFFCEEKILNIPCHDELKKVIKKEFEYSNLFAIKDPRIVFLFPVYKRALVELGVDIKVVIPFRNPMEVAASLHKRNGFSYEKGMLLWIYHILLAEKYSREYERVFIGFNELISDTNSVISLMSEKLHMDFITKYDNNKKCINEYLEPCLKHHSFPIGSLPDNTSEIVKEILRLREEFNDDAVMAKFDALREEFFSYQRLFYNQEIFGSFSELVSAKLNLMEVERQLQQKTEELELSKQQLSEAKQGIKQRSEKFDQSRRQLSEVEQGLQQRTEELELSRQQLNELEQMLKQSVEELHISNLMLTESKHVISQRDQEVNNYKDELVAIYTGRSWKITRPLRWLKRVLK